MRGNCLGWCHICCSLEDGYMLTYLNRLPYITRVGPVGPGLAVREPYGLDRVTWLLWLGSVPFEPQVKDPERWVGPMVWSSLIAACFIAYRSPSLIWSHGSAHQGSNSSTHYTYFSLRVRLDGRRYGLDYMSHGVIWLIYIITMQWLVAKCIYLWGNQLYKTWNIRYLWVWYGNFISLVQWD